MRTAEQAGGPRITVDDPAGILPGQGGIRRRFEYGAKGRFIVTELNTIQKLMAITP